ncbi:complex I NDUFA9 subunit family protein [Kaistia algarum]|uniref:complex I NDUFA9 subunit family protein n=1 Tax=Kaistia algarum TaxID=2083279 RepID=UPI000CE8B143|nr:complex I NDUFA9 subunit family protein [Kaistia algarum]MCX5513823.1 complex I NDUFA9 subunit family protein [Kaistia algarum]PPE79316.1 complex I NDUFA9 subunit family protein [Kaistia algarum]
MTTHSGKLVTVFGGSGFIGRHAIRALAKRGWRIRAAVRRPDLAGHLQPLGTVGQIMPIQANLRYRWSIDRAVEDADAVVNLVGILHESGRQTFGAVQTFGAHAVAEATRNAGIPTLVHQSAIGADPRSDSAYARSKAEAEAAVFETMPGAVVLRPSIVFGPEDRFFNRFADMAQMMPFLPLVGGGATKLQPVFVGDVAEAIARAVEGQVPGGKVYELGGPEVKSFRECMELLLAEIERPRPLLPLPFSLARALASVMQRLPNPMLTVDQVRLLAHDNIVSSAALHEGRTLSGLGIQPTNLSAVLPSYLVRFKPHGQFDHKRTG